MPETAFPLCDRDGAPACGNIGQVGRPAAARAVFAPRAAPADRGAAAPAARPLLAAGVNTGVPIARPLLDDDARPAPGNCVGKCGGDDPRVEIAEPRLARVKPAGPTTPSLSGARIAAIENGGAIVSDEDSGALIAVGADGRNRSVLAIGHGAGLVVVDRVAREAFVADRAGDRIVVASYDGPLSQARSWRAPREPYGTALSPDRATLLVTSIADRVLVAYDARTGAERWRAALGPEPRGIAISPAGTHAIVSYLAVGRVDRVDLRTHRVTPIGIALSQRKDEGKPHARAAFAPLFLDDDLAVVAFQRHVPEPSGERARAATDSYGGVSTPVTHHVAWLAGARQHSIRIADTLPRALAYDGKRDRLFVAALGTDAIVTLEHATTSQLAEGRRIVLARRDEPRCGPESLALADDGALLVWCAFTRRVSRVDLGAREERTGPSLIASSFDEVRHAGRVQFHAAEPSLSNAGTLACATCHPDGRTDGLSWLVGKSLRQTPILAGRVAGTAPYKWDGSDPDLVASVGSTITSLGGHGATVAAKQALAAYVERMSAVVPPSRDAAAIARGRALFDEEGCASCHAGERFVDGKQHAFSGGLAQADTPSLAGLAASAPYYHDGSAATLDALLAGRARVHGMADTSSLTAAQRTDLAAYLESR